jgi:hypothetical protein
MRGRGCGFAGIAPLRRGGGTHARMLTQALGHFKRLTGIKTAWPLTLRFLRLIE